MSSARSNFTPRRYTNQSGKSKSASGWNAWTATTAAIRKSMAQREPTPTGLHCHQCLTYGHTRLHLINGRMVCDGCAGVEAA